MEIKALIIIDGRSWKIGHGFDNFGVPWQVIALKHGIFNTAREKFNGADVSTRWGAYMNEDIRLMDKITLEIDWEVLGYRLEFTFNPRNQDEREFIKKVCNDRRLCLTNLEGILKNEDGVFVETGITIDVELAQALEWIELEEQGKSVYDWISTTKDNWTSE